MTDLRDQLADFEAAARRLLASREQPRPHLVVVHARPASCHPDRPLAARTLCNSCYAMAWRNGRLDTHPLNQDKRSRADFVADYQLLRAEGHSRAQIAERLGMTVAAVTQAYRRAVRAGDLEPDRRRAA